MVVHTSALKDRCTTSPQPQIMCFNDKYKEPYCQKSTLASSGGERVGPELTKYTTDTHARWLPVCDALNKHALHEFLEVPRDLLAQSGLLYAGSTHCDFGERTQVDSKLNKHLHQFDNTHNTAKQKNAMDVSRRHLEANEWDRLVCH